MGKKLLYLKKVKSVNKVQAKRIEELYDARFNSLFIRFTGQYKNENLAADSIQDVFLKLCEMEPADFFKIRYPRAWLSEAVNNQIIDKLRQGKRERFCLIESIIRGSNVPEAGWDAKLDYIQVLEKLDKREYSILYMHYVLGYKYKEISQLKNIPIGTVGTIINRSKNKLKDKF